MRPSPFDRSKVPHKSGVYIFLASDNEVLYVGKAIDLYSRVSSYFSDYQPHPKTASLVDKISSVETIIVQSEIEALILESNLIKKHLPPFNIRLTDDKDYLYIKVTKEDFSRIITARKKDLNDAKAYFGPFPSATTLKMTLRKLRRAFPWCQNPPKKNSSSSPCFYFHLGLCPGPCVGKVDKKQYRQIIKNFCLFMGGRSQTLVKELQARMEQSSKSLDFEAAQALLKTINGIKYLLSPNQAQLYLENPNFLQEQNQKGLEELKTVLSLATLPERIEGFDISNIQGTDATGSMVVLTDGELDKSEYRRFKIRQINRPNDYAMMQEMISRRSKHSEWPTPDLIIIDGGIGQVRAAQSAYKRAGIADTVIYGLAKRMEWLYSPDGRVIKLAKASLGLRLIQKLRDEAHRFAISYHRNLRQKRAFL